MLLPLARPTHRHTLYVLNGDLVANLGEELHRAVDANLNTLRVQGAEDTAGGRRKGGPENVRKRPIYYSDYTTSSRVSENVRCEDRGGMGGVTTRVQ